MYIPDHQIHDLTSFTKVISEPRQIAGIWFYKVLDQLVELAHYVSCDFFLRPELFTELKEEDTEGVSTTIAPILAKLHARYGTDELLLNRYQRHLIYAGLFGQAASSYSQTPDEGSFYNLRDDLLEACATFVETKFGDEASLRENVRQKQTLFKQYLQGLLGDSLRWSSEEALSFVTEKASYRILRNKGVSAVYGIATPPVGAWPYDFDSNADKLVEEISKRLLWKVKFERKEMKEEKQNKKPLRQEEHEPREMEDKRGMYEHISRAQITNLQRNAIEGTKAIATAMDITSSSSDDEIDLLISKCYPWLTAIRNTRNDFPPYSRAAKYRSSDEKQEDGTPAESSLSTIRRPMKS